MGRTLHLVGARFGALTVLAQAAPPPPPRPSGTYWRCRCDCGREEVYRLNRLRQCSVTACERCDAGACAVCGGPLPGRGWRICPAEGCRREAERAAGRRSYHRRIADPVRGPELRAQRQARGRQRWEAMTPEERRADVARRTAQQRAREAADPAAREAGVSVTRLVYAALVTAGVIEEDAP